MDSPVGPPTAVAPPRARQLPCAATSLHLRPLYGRRVPISTSTSLSRESQPGLPGLQARPPGPMPCRGQLPPVPLHPRGAPPTRHDQRTQDQRDQPPNPGGATRSLMNTVPLHAFYANAQDAQGYLNTAEQIRRTHSNANACKTAVWAGPGPYNTSTPPHIFSTYI